MKHSTSALIGYGINIYFFFLILIYRITNVQRPATTLQRNSVCVWENVKSNYYGRDENSIVVPAVLSMRDRMDDVRSG